MVYNKNNVNNVLSNIALIIQSVISNIMKIVVCNIVEKKKKVMWSCDIKGFKLSLPFLP